MAEIMGPTGLGVIPPWKNREAFLDLEELWVQVKEAVFKSMLGYLVNNSLITTEEKARFEFRENFYKEPVWEIIVNEKKILNCSGSHLSEVKIIKISGALDMLWDSKELKPCFSFTASSENNKVYFDRKLIEKIVSDARKIRENSIDATFGEGTENEFIVFNADLKRKAQETINKILPMLTGGTLAFSKDEAMLMVHQAVNHKDFREGMKPEEIVGLALRARGKGAA